MSEEKKPEPVVPLPPDILVQDVPSPAKLPPQLSVPLENRTSILREMDIGSEETPLMIHEQLEEARKLARRTGQRVQRRFNKRDFIRQFPQAGSDPRMAFTPNSFLLDVTPLAVLTIGELRNMCLACKGHPLSLQKVMQVEGLADSITIRILKEEYMILKNAAK